ncbi:hypothetical protein GGI00_004697 [Coemansia sp. RSA 2681]|nr:hypothetical protein GGI00_004697 [Coemansia sp. RSA 2681]
MVCVLCYDLLFGSLARDDQASSRRIAALSCGHTFHLECITLWCAESAYTACPKCNVRDAGPILALHVERDLDHVAYDESSGLATDSPLQAAELLCNSSLDSAEQQEIRYKELEAKTAALQTKLDETNGQLKRVQTDTGALYKNLARLGDREKELSTLSERHKASIHGLHSALELGKQTIARLEETISAQQ